MRSRCYKCILPRSFPSIEFNGEDVCNYCQNELGVPSKKLNKLPPEIINSRQILVGLSGGKDSTYGLLFLHENLKSEIISFTYEWPMVNELARQNASKIVSFLGVEHIVRSPDTFKQLKFIRRIVLALSKVPDARAIPLLLAPDKYFFREAKKVAKKYGIKNIMFCSGNELEYTDFKSLLLGSGQSNPNEMFTSSFRDAVRIFKTSIVIYLKNPRLFLAGVKIPIETYLITYIYKRDIFMLYNYIDWNEKKINSKLQGLWHNNGDGSEKSDWRAGDGSAEFYNFLYRSILGFDERTCNLSNKVRAGLMSRNEALLLDLEYSKPNYQLLEKYAQKVGFNLDEFLLNWNKNLMKL